MTSETLLVFVLFVLFVGALFVYKTILEKIEQTSWFKNPIIKFIFLTFASSFVGLILFVVARIAVGQ